MTGTRLVRAALFALPLLWTSLPAVAAPPTVTRVNGAVTVENFGKFAKFIDQSLDKVIGLQLQFEKNDETVDGQMTATTDGDSFLAFVAGPDNDTEIDAPGGFAFAHGFYTFDGYYLVKDGGFNQGISAYVLEPVDESKIYLSGAPVENVEIDDLDN